MSNYQIALQFRTGAVAIEAYLCRVNMACMVKYGQMRLNVGKYR